jgi:hypothetical protein
MSLIVSKTFVVCPACNEEARYPINTAGGHLEGSFTTKPTCDKCGVKSSYEMTLVNGVLTCEKVTQLGVEQKKCLSLLRYNKEGSMLYVVVMNWTYKHCEFDLDREYHYNEGTCPTNWLGVTMIVEDGDPDPHGVFQFVRSVLIEDLVKEMGVTEGQLLGSNNEDLLCTIFPEVIPRDLEEIIH